MRSTCRLTGVAKKTVERLLVSAGKACKEFHDRTMRNLPCKVLQLDEIHSFTYSKQKNIPEHLKGQDGIGDTWCWIAIDADSKLIPSWHVGQRDAVHAYWFVHDLKDRLAGRAQITSDGLKCYVEAVESAFGSAVDFAQLIKIYGKQVQYTEVRYSPPEVIGTRRRRVIGKPVRGLISTSFVERQNLTLRMSNRRYTRLTNGYSKKIENHCHMLAIHFVHYNFARIHHSLRVTPAMQIGLSDHVWSLEEIAELVG